LFLVTVIVIVNYPTLVDIDFQLMMSSTMITKSD